MCQQFSVTGVSHSLPQTYFFIISFNLQPLSPTTLDATVNIFCNGFMSRRLLECNRHLLAFRVSRYCNSSHCNQRSHRHSLLLFPLQPHLLMHLPLFWPMQPNLLSNLIELCQILPLRTISKSFIQIDFVFELITLSLLLEGNLYLWLLQPLTWIHDGQISPHFFIILNMMQ